MAGVADDLPHALRRQMSRPDERANFENWWDQSNLSDMAMGRLAEPVHDLGVMSIFEEKDEA